MKEQQISIASLISKRGTKKSIRFKVKSAFEFAEAPGTVFLPKSKEEARTYYRVCVFDGEFGRYAGYDNLQSLNDNRKAIEVTVELCEGGGHSELIPVKKLSYIHYAQEDFRLVYMVDTHQLYCMPDTAQMPIALTRNGVIAFEMQNSCHQKIIFFPQKKGALPFTPDCRGYVKLEDSGDICLPHTICRYMTATMDFIKVSDIKECEAKYAELKKKYKEEPVIYSCWGEDDPLRSVDEDEWRAYQHRRGYIRMDYQTFIESDFATKRLDCNIKQLMDAGLQRIGIGPAATHYYFIPKHWLKPAGFYTDPNVLKSIPKARALVSSILNMSPEEQARVRATIRG